MFPDLSTTNLIALDTETDGVNPRENRIVGVVLTWSPDPAHSKYYPIRHAGGGNLEDGPVIDYFKKLLLNPNLRVVFHNAEFDLSMLSNEGIVVEGPVEDTMINAALINEHMKSFSLAYCCEFAHVAAKKGQPLYEHLARQFGGKANREQMANYHKLRGDDEVAAEYAVGDGTSTFQLRGWQHKEMEEQGLMNTWGVECRLIKTLHRAKLRGVPVNVPVLTQVQEQIDAELSLARAEIGFINTGSAREKQDWLEKQRAKGEDVPPWPKTKPSSRHPQGQNSFPSKYLEKFPAGNKIAVVSKLNKLATAFIKPLVEKHLVGDKVYPSFAQTKDDSYGTGTGRLSSYKPNMQQVTKRDKRLGKLFRQVFVPPKGMSWHEFDYKSCEYRLFAHYSKSKRLIEGFNLHGLDLHDMVADMLGIGRDKAKNMNFGLLFGMGEKSLAGHMDMPLSDALAKREEYFREVPEAERVMKTAAATCRKNGFIRTLMGRRRRWLNPRKHDYQALNAACQGSGGDLMKCKMVEVEEYLMSLGNGAEYAFSVHDANNFFAPIGDEKTVAEVKRISEDLTTLPFKIRVNMPTDTVGPGTDWARASYEAKHFEEETEA